ncbi:MAG: hypothetical protein WA151_07880 [Desulfatirhabdiaceae bacterium]
MMQYTCNDYRLEMILLGLTRRLNQEDLSETERALLIEEISRIETEMTATAAH